MPRAPSHRGWKLADVCANTLNAPPTRLVFPWPGPGNGGGGFVAACCCWRHQHGSLEHCTGSSDLGGGSVCLRCVTAGVRPTRPENRPSVFVKARPCFTLPFPCPVPLLPSTVRSAAIAVDPAHRLIPTRQWGTQPWASSLVFDCEVAGLASTDRACPTPPGAWPALLTDDPGVTGRGSPLSIRFSGGGSVPAPASAFTLSVRLPACGGRATDAQCPTRMGVWRVPLCPPQPWPRPHASVHAATLLFESLQTMCVGLRLAPLLACLPTYQQPQAWVVLDSRAQDPFPILSLSRGGTPSASGYDAVVFRCCVV